MQGMPWGSQMHCPARAQWLTGQGPGSASVALWLTWPARPPTGRASLSSCPGRPPSSALREACGPFSAAKILKAAMEEAELTQQAVDGWVLMQPGDLSQLTVG